MQSAAKGDVPAERLGQGPGHRSQRQLGHDLAPGAAHVRHDDDAGAPVQQIVEGRQGLFHAAGLGDLAVLHRHVEIGAHQHPFSGDVEIVDGLEGAHG